MERVTNRCPGLLFGTRAKLINRYPGRFLFGSDEVAPTNQAGYLKTYDMYAPCLRS
jgi:hypothetical protein